MRLDHINIKAPEVLMEQIREFYCSVLGLAEGPRPDFSKPGYWLYADGHPLVHLLLESESPAGGAAGHIDHVAFRAVDLQAFTARLEAFEVSYRSSRVPELGLTQLFFKDPAGTGLEINFANEVMP